MGGRTWRWGVVFAVAAALLALPLVVAALPAGAPSADAAALLARVRAADDRPYSGYAESTGSMALPASEDLDDVASLLGGRTQQRVWWRSARDWRSDILTPTGEVGTRTTQTGATVWDYEDNRAVLTESDRPGDIRLPRASDTLPPQLAARLLSGATADRVSGLPSRRVAGRESDGLRLRPDDELSSIERVDVWADRASGVAVLVEVYGRGAGSPAMSSTFLDFTDAPPDPAATSFTPPSDVRIRTGQRFDLVSSMGQFPGTGLPDRLLGYPRATPSPGLSGIAQYGRGVTQFAVGTLPAGSAASLREQLSVAGGAVKLPEGIAVSIGPVALMLTEPALTGENWLLAGTLTHDGLVRAAAALRQGSAS